MTNPLYPAWMRRPEEAAKGEKTFPKNGQKRQEPPTDGDNERARSLERGEKKLEALGATDQKPVREGSWDFLFEGGLPAEPSTPRSVIKARHRYNRVMAFGQKLAQSNMGALCQADEARLKSFVHEYMSIADNNSPKAKRVMSAINELREKRDAKTRSRLDVWQGALDRARDHYNAVAQKAGVVTSVNGVCKRCKNRGMGHYRHVQRGACFECGRLPYISLRDF